MSTWSSANLLLPWIDDPVDAFREVSRVLRQDGLFVFSTLGPDSMLSLRTAWRTADDGEHVNRFIDMHEVGDALVRAGLRDPVLDVDRLNVTYENQEALFRDLTATGSRNCLAMRRRGLTGRDRFETMRRALNAIPGGEHLSLEFELVYGHCWGGAGPGGGDVAIRCEPDSAAPAVNFALQQMGLIRNDGSFASRC